MDINTSQNLLDELLSDENVEFLFDMLKKKVKISPNLFPECEKILRIFLRKYGKPFKDHPPTDDLIGSINKEAYMKFEAHLMKNVKPPTPQSSQSSQALQSPQTSSRLPTKLDTIQSPIQSPQNMTVEQHQSEDDDIITEDEKNRLIAEQYTSINNLIGVMNSVDIKEKILTYLSHPVIIDEFIKMIEEINKTSINISAALNPDLEEEIISGEEFKRIMVDFYKIQPKEPDILQQIVPLFEKNVQTAQLNLDHGSNRSSGIIGSSEQNNANMTNNMDSVLDLDLDLEKQLSSKNSEEFSSVIPEEQLAQIDVKDEDKIICPVDLSAITAEDLPKIKSHLDFISSISKTSSSETKTKINLEKDRIKAAVLKYSKYLEQQKQNNDSELKALNSGPVKNKNGDILSLSVVPKHPDVLRKFVIEFDKKTKIHEITLISHNIELNKNNINRFNHRFACVYDSKVHMHELPHGSYNINQLFDLLHKQFPFLEFSIDFKNYVTIKNKLGSNFDLFIKEDDTIFEILGFIDRASTYQNKTTYSGLRAYELSANKKLMIRLEGMPSNECELQFGSEKNNEQYCIKKSSAGVELKHIHLKLVDSLDKTYDIESEFNISLLIKEGK
jgi:hypothetical protein